MANDRDPIAAARRVSAAELGSATVQNELLDLEFWDMRFAATLNIMDMARAQGQHPDWTSDHSKAVRDIMKIVDSVVLGEGMGAVPQGFGPTIRTQLSAAFERARAAAANPPPKAAQPDWQGHGWPANGDASPADQAAAA